MKGRSEQGQKQAEYGFIHAVKVRLGPTFSVYPIDPYPMRSLLVASILALSGGTLVAQWNPNTAVNTPVATGTTDDLEAITGPSGRTYVVMFQPTTSGYSPRLQVLNGQGVPRLGTNGMQFNTTTSMSTYTVTWDLRLDFVAHDDTLQEARAAGNVSMDATQARTGNGVRVENLKRAQDSFLAGTLRIATSRAQELDTLSGELSQVSDILSNTDTNLSGPANRLFDAFAQLALQLAVHQAPGRQLRGKALDLLRGEGRGRHAQRTGAQAIIGPAAPTARCRRSEPSCRSPSGCSRCW